MDEHAESGVSEHERAVERYYAEATPGFYVNGWHADHIHFGLFETGECPEEGEPLPESAGLARAVERMIEEIVAPVRIGENHHVVDAGCGIGGTAMYLARTRGCRVTGVNVCRPQIDVARRKAVEAGLHDRVAFEYADCSRHLPFADDSVDAVVNIESACHYSDRGQFLREVRRILKPGRRIAAMDWLARDGLTSGQHEKFIRPMFEPWTVVSLESRSTYAERLRETGLTIIEVEGFNGKDACNVELIGRASRLLTALWFGGMTSDAHRGLMDRMGTLYAAWHGGYFELGRYCAEKPGMA